MLPRSIAQYARTRLAYNPSARGEREKGTHSMENAVEVRQGQGNDGKLMRMSEKIDGLWFHGRC